VQLESLADVCVYHLALNKIQKIIEEGVNTPAIL
jgi:hypothetical protein